MGKLACIYVGQRKKVVVCFCVEVSAAAGAVARTLLDHAIYMP